MTVLRVDRFEGEYALCEEHSACGIVHIPLVELPDGVREGDLLAFTDGRYVVDQEATERLRKRILEKQNRLWEE